MGENAMSKQISINVTFQELCDIVEALEQFVSSTPTDVPGIDDTAALLLRLDNLKAKLDGEPEEGW